MGLLFGTSVALADGAAAAETSNYSLNVGETLMGLVRDTGFGAFFVGDGWKMLAMIIIGCVLLYLAIHKGFEPLLLLPIGFGMILSNLPLAGLMDEGGLLYYLYKGVKLGIYPPLIFLGVGAMTDFGPLIANPKSLFLGAAAQLGIFIAFTGAILLGRSVGLGLGDAVVEVGAGILVGRHSVDFAVDGHAIPQSLGIGSHDVLAVLVEQVGQRIERFLSNEVSIVIGDEGQVERLAGGDQQLQLLQMVVIVVFVHRQRGVELFGHLLVDLGHNRIFGAGGGAQCVPYYVIGLQRAGVYGCGVSHSKRSAGHTHSGGQSQGQELFHLTFLLKIIYYVRR